MVPWVGYSHLSYFSIHAGFKLKGTKIKSCASFIPIKLIY